VSEPYFLCQCEKDWCWCSNRAATQGATCFMCEQGAHAEPSGERFEEPKPSVKPGCAPTFMTLFVIATPLFLMAVAAWAVVASLIWVVSKVVR
jgi:hypothetical protein